MCQCQNGVRGMCSGPLACNMSSVASSLVETVLPLPIGVVTPVSVPTSPSTVAPLDVAAPASLVPPNVESESQNITSADNASPVGNSEKIASVGPSTSTACSLPSATSDSLRWEFSNKDVISEMAAAREGQCQVVDPLQEGVSEKVPHWHIIIL